MNINAYINVCVTRKTAIYTGAGISTSCGIKQTARGKTGRSGIHNTGACPSITHLVMSALVKAGAIHHWVQQNHDGLAQKAGCPQEAITEIHGSWFDPSNPVVSVKQGFKNKHFYLSMNRFLSYRKVLLTFCNLSPHYNRICTLYASAGQLSMFSLVFFILNGIELRWR